MKKAPPKTGIDALGGWFDFPEIYDRAVEEAQDGDTLVEVGVYLGKSLLYLGRKAKESGKNLKIIGIDIFRQMSDTNIYANAGGYWLHTVANSIAEFELTDTISLLQCPSQQASRLFDDESLHFVFIDADHRYEAVRADILAWLPKIRQHSLIGGHDYIVCPGVSKACSEVLDYHKLDLCLSAGSWLYVKD